MSSPLLSLVDVPAMPDDAGPVDPATSTRIGSFHHDRENGYNLEWESRADFNNWLKHEQVAHGIEIRVSKTWKARHLYSMCETFRCARNGTGGKKHYVKKTAREYKIESKRIDGGCPCFVQIKTYPHTNTILGKYSHDHSHPTGKDNLKYVRIRVSTRDLIEVWVHYGVTDQEIVSDPSLITTDLTNIFQKKKIRSWFSEHERDHYITNGEICRIRKEILRTDIRLDANDAHSTRIWVSKLQSQGDFVYYKDKRDLPPAGSALADNLFALCIQTKFQKDAYKRLGNGFLGIDATHNVTQYKGILLFTLMARDNWGHGM